MIHSIGQVMLYVMDTAESLTFWTEKVGFQLLATEQLPGATAYTIAPKKDSDVQFVLHDKSWVQQHSPEVTLTFPSLLLATTDLDSTHADMTAAGVETNPIADIPFRHFSFADPDGNHIAIREVTL